jgi:hypothetical protein
MVGQHLTQAAIVAFETAFLPQSENDGRISGRDRGEVHFLVTGKTAYVFGQQDQTLIKSVKELGAMAPSDEIVSVIDQGATEHPPA